MKKVKLVSAERVLLEDYTPEELNANEVSLEMKYCGICGSDVHAYMNKHPFITLPRVPGHECSGVIREVGRKSEEFKIGQKATFIPQLTCGQCCNCKKGRYNICENLEVIGAQGDGAMREVFNVSSDLIVPLPNHLDLMEAALIEPLAVAVHAAKIIGEIDNKDVIVVGAGTIGQLITQVVKDAGASTVLSIDVDDSRLELVNRLGADFVINAGEIINKNYVKKISGERGAEVIFEAVGKKETMKQAVELVKKGGRIAVVGVFSEKVRIDMKKVQDQEISIQGSLMYLREDFQRAIELLMNKVVKVKPLVYKIFNLEEAKDAFEAARSSHAPPKVLLKINQDPDLLSEGFSGNESCSV